MGGLVGMDLIWSVFALTAASIFLLGFLAGKLVRQGGAERALRDSEEKFRVAFETSPDAVQINRLDDGRFVSVNRGFSALTGYTAEDVKSRTTSDLDLWVDAAQREEISRRLRQEGMVKDFEAEFRLRDGRIRRGLVSATTIELQGETHLLAVTRDVTEEQKAQAELQAAVEELRRANDDLEHFAYAASHDLQEPLRMITSYLQLLERRCADSVDTGDASEFISYAVEGATRMRSLIQDLQVYARIRGNGRPVPCSDAADICRQVVHGLGLRLEETGARVHCGELPKVQADPGHLEQLMANLLENALNYRREGTAPEVRISAEPLGERWLFTVEDNGIGVPPQYRERIFQIFQRLQTRGEVPGNGLGLALCRRIVERYGGRIWVESGTQSGAVFRFTLPKA